MIMKKYTVIIFLSLLTLVSCLKDETKPFNGNFDGWEIEGLERNYDTKIGARFYVPISVKINHIKDESSLQYFWIMSSPTAPEPDTVSREKDIDVFISGKYGETISCQLHVLDVKNDIRYKKSTIIRAISGYKSGWVVLSEKDDKGYLSFIATLKDGDDEDEEDDIEITTDLYGKEFGEPMPKGKYLGYFPVSKSSGIGIVLEETPEKTFFLEGKGLSHAGTLASMFSTMDYVEGPFAPKNMSIDITVFGNGIMYVLANKRIYAKSGSLTMNSNVFGASVDGDYEVDELFGTMGPQGQSFVTYDYKNKRYIYVTNENITTVQTYSSPTPEYPFDISNTDVTPLWMGSSKPKYEDAYFVAVVKNNETQKYQVQQFHILRVKVDGIYGFHLQRIDLYDLPEDRYNPNCKICTSGNVMYIANNREIYRLNLEVFGKMSLVTTMDEDITCLQYFNNQAIAVATKSETGDLQGNLRIVSTQTENLGEILNDYRSVGGVIVDMQYKKD